MDIDGIAAELVDVARESGQAVLRCDESTPIELLRAAVRTVAAEQDVRIRTGLVDGVLAVVRANADLWHDSAPEMREKLMPPAEPNIVG